MQQKLGRKYPHDVLPETELIRYFAFKLAGENVQEWRWICENMTRLDVFQAFAMKRTSFYIAYEEPERYEEQVTE